LKGTDAFVGTHLGTDRSKVVEEALLLWHLRRQQQDMAAQFTEPE
jgi:hypothetical protein